MTRIILKTLTICLLGMFNPAMAQQIWYEAFNIPEKGIWGSEEGRIISDLTGITRWQLEYVELNLQDIGDYAKTVATSGGRFEACDIDGEITWLSEWIDISLFSKVHIQLTASETGSGANTSSKYLKACYRIGVSKEFTFGENGNNAGNWGTVVASQENVMADSLQIVCYISTHYASDKVILDEVKVWQDQEPFPPVKPFDVVINEMMVDPSPPESLPEVEYIELFNTLDFPVSTSGWELRINGVSKKLQECVIASGNYLLLCSTGALDHLRSYGNVSNVVGFQGLLNKGATVEILDKNGNLLDHVVYADSWYGDPFRSNGGWSLERIDPFRHCNQSGNWKASLHPDGGTPGMQNSVLAENPDIISPTLKWAVAVSPNEAELVFSEPLDTSLLLNPANYHLSEFENPTGIKKINSEKVLLCFQERFQIDKIYRLQLDNLADECGNAISDDVFELQWNSIEPGDLLINELLFDPFPGGEDFVEIYNNSFKIIDLSRIQFANRNKKFELNQVFSVTVDRIVLPPESYLVLTKDTQAVFPWYYIKCPGCFIQMEKFPSYPNEQGCVVVLNEERSVVDEFYYSEKMHSPFLSIAEGISLERISFKAGTNVRGNWHSASAEAGYGTPGYQNSQSASTYSGRPKVQFEPKSFSPNNDGYNDILLITYETEQAGFVANIKMFDSSGRFLFNLVKNELMGVVGSFSWNGEDNTGSRQPPGVYIVWVEIFNAGGEVYRFRDGVILTDIFQ